MSFLNQRYIFDLSFCSNRTKEALRGFCNNINQCDADVIIVMAQKAVCLFTVLREQGLFQEKINEKTIISSTALDFGAMDFSGKRIAIIDDIIVSGSAISSVVSKLIKLCSGVELSRIQVIGLALDKKYQSMQFTDENGNSLLKCGYEMDDAECIELSYDLSRVFSYYGRPYDTDFPIYERIEMTISHFSRLINGINFVNFDVTNIVQENSGVSAAVLFPTDTTKERIWERLGSSLHSIIHLKVRIYYQRVTRNRILCRFVPMALFKEISEDIISKIFDSIVDERIVELAHIRMWGVVAKFRFLQFYVATVLMEELLSINKSETVALSSESFHLLFGPGSSATIEGVLATNDSSVAKDISFSSTYPIPPDTLVYKANRFELDQVSEETESYQINERLFSPFADWYFEKEIPARNELLHPRKHFVFDKEQIGELANRLRKGYSFEALKKILGNVGEQYNIDYVVSLFIDRAIDEGVIVPIVYHNIEAQYICRAYRHGEDLPFGEADRCRLLYFLSCLNKNLVSFGVENGIAPRSLEKMIVMFYQIGLRGIYGKGSIFNRFLGFDNMLVLQERFSVHGAIQSINRISESGEGPQPHLYYEVNDDRVENEEELKYTQWLTYWLDSRGIIKRVTHDDQNTHCIINTDEIVKNNRLFDPSNLSHEIRKDIEKIAEILSQWYSGYTSRDQFKEDITVLTSCYDMNTFASALATELHYFKKYCENDLRRSLNELHECDDEQRRSVSFARETTAQALYSGREKYEWYCNGRAREVIEQVGKLLQANNHLWESIWSAHINVEARNDELTQLITEGMGYLYFYSVCYDWVNSGRLLGNIKGEFLESTRSIRECYEKFKVCAANCSDLDTRLFELFATLEKEDTLDKREQLFCKRIRKALGRTEGIIDKIESYLSSYSSFYSITYDSCLLLDVKTSNRKESDNILLNLWSQFDEDKEKTRLNIIRWGNYDAEYQRYAVFYRALDDVGPEMNLISRAYVEVTGMLDSKALSYRCLLIPRLPQSAIYKHNLQKNAHNQFEKFNNKIKRVERFWKNNCKSETVLIISDDNKNLGYLDLVKREGTLEDNEIQAVDFDEFDYSLVWRFYVPKRLQKEELRKLRVGTSGTGFLFQHEGRVYCITCKHLIPECKKVLLYSPNSEYKYEGCLIPECNDPTESELFHDSDVAVLSIDEALTKDIARDDVLSVEACIASSEYEENEYECFGYPNKRGRRIKGLRVNGEATNGYIQIVDKDGELTGGFSGAALICQERLLGMHVERSIDNNNKEYPYALSCWAILEELEKLKKGSKK